MFPILIQLSDLPSYLGSISQVLARYLLSAFGPRRLAGRLLSVRSSGPPAQLYTQLGSHLDSPREIQRLILYKKEI